MHSVWFSSALKEEVFHAVGVSGCQFGTRTDENIQCGQIAVIGRVPKRGPTALVDSPDRRVIGCQQFNDFWRARRGRSRRRDWPSSRTGNGAASRWRRLATVSPSQLPTAAEIGVAPVTASAEASAPFARRILTMSAWPLRAAS